MKQKGFTHILLILVVAVGIGALGYFAYKNGQIKLVQQENSLLPSPAKDLTKDWKIYTNNKYGFEFKYPPNNKLEVREVEGTNKQYISVNNGPDTLAIYPEFFGIGFEDPKIETKNIPLVINGKQLVISEKNIEKIKVTTTYPKATDTFFLVIIPYPFEIDYMVSANYRFLNGSVNSSSEELFDQILSTFQFFDPGEASVLNPTGITSFSSKYLKLSFRYPSSWGQIEEILKPGTAGKRYDLSFDGNVGGSALGFGSFTAGGRSKDFTEGRGGYIVDAAMGFSSPKEFCDSYLGKQGINCETINQNIVVQLVAPKYEDVCPPNPGQYWFSKRVWINLPGQEVDGFMLEYTNFWSKEFTEMSDPDLECSKTNKEKFEAAVSKIIERLNSGDLDKITKTNINGFDAFVKSITLN